MVDDLFLFIVKWIPWVMSGLDVLCGLMLWNAPIWILRTTFLAAPQPLNFLGLHELLETLDWYTIS
jgi:hypothetical protein